MDRTLDDRVGYVQAYFLIAMLFQETLSSLYLGKSTVWRSKYSGEKKRQLLRISQEVGRDADLGPSESAPSSTCN